MFTVHGQVACKGFSITRRCGRLIAHGSMVRYDRWMAEQRHNLVVGGDSVIGRALVNYYNRAGIPVCATTRRNCEVGSGRIFLDLGEVPQKWALPEDVEVAYLCAAVSRTIPCRRDPEGTWLINVERVVRLAESLLVRGGRVVFLSTNQVFSGKTPCAGVDQPPRPVSEYGRQKAEAERRLLGLGSGVVVVRLSKVIHQGDALLTGWVKRLREGRVIQPLCDYHVAPLRLDFVVEALTAVAGGEGLYQLSGTKDISYAEVGTYLAARVGAYEHLVQPRTTAESGLELEAFGPHTTLDSSRLLEHTGLMPPDVWKAVDIVLESGE